MIPAHVARAQIVSNYSLLDTSWGLDFTTNGNAQTGWLVTSGDVAGTTVSVNSAHYVNSNLYYIGYVFDGSYTYSPTTGVWGNTNNASAANGYLSSEANAVTISVAFPQAVNVGMMRLYPGGWSGYAGTDYAVSYQQGTNWTSLIPLQGVASGNTQTYVDHAFSNAVSAQNWRIFISNGTGGWGENATFGEVQFYTDTPGYNLWAPTAGGGGSGVWTSNSTNWASVAGQQGNSNIATMGSAAFGGTAGTVDVSGTVSPIAGMRFSTDGYVVTNGTISLAGSSNVFNMIIADTNVGVRVESVLAGTNGFSKGGEGTVTLNGTNTYTGVTLVTGGTLVGNTTSIRGAITNDATVVFSQATNATISNAISGTGVFAKTGSGTLTLSATNTYSGGTLVSAGAVSGNADALQGNITNNAAVFFTQATNDTYAGAMSGSGTMEKSGLGTLTLSAANSYSGGTLVSGGALSGNADAIQGNITNNAAVIFTQATNDTYAGAMSGSGSLTKTSAGTLTLTGSNSYAGTTRIQAGAVALGATQALYGGDTNNWTAANITVSNGATLVLAGGGAGQFTSGDIATLLGNLTTVNSNGLQGGATLGLDVTNALSVTSTVANSAGAGGGTISLVKYGSGTLTLAASNSYSGSTLVTAGRLVGDSSSIRGAVTNNAAVTFDQASDGTFSNVISGSGSLVKSSTGTLTLTAANSYSGGTLVSAGTLSGRADALQGAITNNATVNFNQTTNDSYAGVISGAGSFVKSGAGNLTNTANSTYSGTTTVEAGRLVISGTNTNTTTTINSGAYLGGTGRVGPVTVGGTIAPGNSVGRFNAATTTLAPAGSYEFEMFNFAGASGTGWDLLAITGNLILSNTIDNPFTVNLISMSSTTARGVSANFNANNNYTNTFASYSGSLAGNDFNANLFTVNTGSFSNAFGGTFRVTTNAGGLALLYIASFDASAPYTWTNGSGLWTLNPGWTNNATPTNGAALIIKGAGGTNTNNGLVSSVSSLTFSNTSNSVTLDGTVISVGSNGIVNASSNTHAVYVPINLTNSSTINAASNNLTVGGNVTNNGAVLTVAGDASTTINGRISGAGALAKTGLGTLTLNASNNYTGGNDVSGGRLVGNANSIRGDVTNNAAVTFNQSAAGTYSNVISGTGSVTKAGTNRLTMSGINTYSGVTTIEDGTLVINGSNASTTVNVQNGASLGGSGVTGGLIVSGELSPGNSIGILTSGDTTFNGGGSFQLEFYDWLGTGGTGWDLLSITGNLTLSNTALNPFTINLVSFQSTNAAGLSINWDENTDYTRVFVTNTGGLLGNPFASNLFAVDTSLFQNPINGVFSVTNVGNSLALNYKTSYAPPIPGVPEPGTWAAAALLTAGAALVRWRRRKG